MIGKAAVVVLSGLLFACAQTPQASAPPPPAPASAAAAESTREHHIVSIRTVTCGGMLSASEEDRAAASMFYIGYTSSRRGVAKIDIAEVEGLETVALSYCAANPDRPAAEAFMKAFHENGR